MYLERGIYPDDPFVSIDQTGVGALMRMAVAKGRAARKDLEIEICGEHGGEPRSVMFCHEIGLDYESCSPYRVSIATLAAAHAAMKVKVKEMGKKWWGWVSSINSAGNGNPRLEWMAETS